MRVQVTVLIFVFLRLRLFISLDYWLSSWVLCLKLSASLTKVGIRTLQFYSWERKVWGSVNTLCWKAILTTLASLPIFLAEWWLHLFPWIVTSWILGPRRVEGYYINWTSKEPFSVNEKYFAVQGAFLQVSNNQSGFHWGNCPRNSVLRTPHFSAL